jgi:hypothetical protein
MNREKLLLCGGMDNDRKLSKNWTLQLRTDGSGLLATSRSRDVSCRDVGVRRQALTTA